MIEGRNVPENLFLHDPAVFAVEDNYCIVFNTLTNGMGWIEVDGEKYINDRNGSIISNLNVHKNYVPMDVLNKAGKYDIVFTPVYDRKAYFALTGEEQRKTYEFKAPNTNKEKFNIYHIADTHSAVEYPVEAATYFGDDLDLLIMNGDIPNHCGTLEHVMTVFELSDKITHGSIPIVFSKGNHDNRGEMAQYYYLYTPTSKSGNTYFTFKIGNIWGLVLDCGEDKIDAHPEYGGLACFEPFRKRETEFIRNIVKDKEYEADDIEHRLLVCHIPIDDPWNEFQREVYTEWTQLVNEIDPDVILYGHTHMYEYKEAGTETIFGKVNAPMIIGGDPRGDDYKGLALTLQKSGIKASFTNKNKEIIEKHEIKNKRK